MEEVIFHFGPQFHEGPIWREPKGKEAGNYHQMLFILRNYYYLYV